MGDDSRVERFLKSKLRSAGRQAAEAREEYLASKAAAKWGLPTDEDGEARLICRRHADRRTVPVDLEGRPACFDPDHPDCQGCVEDLRDGLVETW